MNNICAALNIIKISYTDVKIQYSHCGQCVRYILLSEYVMTDSSFLY